MAAARAANLPESDADIAVILRGARGVALSLEMAGIAFHVMMKTGVLVQGLSLWDDELHRPETFSNPVLIQNVLRDGVHL